MRVLVDAMCADFGGIRTYVDQLLTHWPAAAPADEVHVVVPTGSGISYADVTTHELTVRRPSVIGRPVAQTAGLQGLVHSTRAEVVLATAPTTTTRRLDVPLADVVHDLRHQVLPEQFSPARRALRSASYGRSYEIADGFICVSKRTLDDLRALHPGLTGKPAHVVHHGADHVLAWGEPSRTGGAVTFAHHSNKNPELVLDAWQRLMVDESDSLGERVSRPPHLTVLGVPRTARPSLTRAITARGLEDLVALAPYLPADEFQATFAAADLVVFPSDFEGFGLPVLEGMLLGKPVVIGPERGTLEVSGGHAFVMEDWDADWLVSAVHDARGASDQAIEAARSWAARFTWQRTVEQTREALAALARPRSAGPGPGQDA